MTAEETSATGQPPRSFWRAFHISRTGASHSRNNTECEDASLSWWSDPDGRWAWVIVADGHGSERAFRSATGAGFAVEVLREEFDGLIRRYDELRQGTGPTSGSDVVKDLEARWKDSDARVVTKWREMVQQDLADRPPRVCDDEPGLLRCLDRIHKTSGWPKVARFIIAVNDAEQNPDRIAPTRPPVAADDAIPFPDEFGQWQTSAYGTTLLGILVGPESLHWYQLGDGALVEVTGDETKLLVQPPPGAFAGSTPSLASGSAERLANVRTISLGSSNLPKAVAVATDGVVESHVEVQGFLDFISGVANEVHQPDVRDEKVPRWLDEISQGGVGDDVSLAMAYLDEPATVTPDYGEHLDEQLTPPKIDSAGRGSFTVVNTQDAGEVEVGVMEDGATLQPSDSETDQQLEDQIRESGGNPEQPGEGQSRC